MSTLSEIKNAIKIISTTGTLKNIEILHCISQYPAEKKNLNLNLLSIFKIILNCSGFSDHSLGDHASLVAIGLGSRVIEKHFTLNKNQKGPDHKSSLTEELISFIKKIRYAE